VVTQRMAQVAGAMAAIGRHSSWQALTRVRLWPRRLMGEIDRILGVGTHPGSPGQLYLERVYELPDEVRAALTAFRVCEFSTLAKDGTPLTHPVGALLLEDGTFRLTTSIGLPNKVFHIRRNPAVSMLYSEPTGSKLADPPTVLVQGSASAPDEIITDLSADEQYWLNTIMRRQPDAAFISAWPVRLLTWWYYMRIRITVVPERIRYWPGGDMAQDAIEIPLGSP
jgi:Pyridoxamine 5'-phosphate oxidase